ncbi:MAG: ABC transporter permease [Thermoanaerobaculia bacterium]
MASTRRIRGPLLELTVARTKQFAREPEAVFWVFVFPVLLAFALGFAFREKAPDRIPVGVADGPGASAAFAALSGSPVLMPKVLTPEAGREDLRAGKISLLVDAGPPLLFRFDPTRPDARAARLEAADALERAAGRPDPVTIAEEQVAEPGGRYIDFLIPGILGMNIMGTGVWSLAFSVVTARTRNLLKRFLATPMRKSDYLISQMLSRFVFLVFEVAVLVAFGWWVFGVGVRGSILLFSFLCLVGAFSFAGLGLLVGARPTTIEGVSGLANLVLFPMWILSGVFFSYERFPAAAIPLIRALPLTALNDALRAVMNDGAGPVGILPQLGVLAAWGIGSFALALKLFRWK